MKNTRRKIKRAIKINNKNVNSQNVNSSQTQEVKNGEIEEIELDNCRNVALDNFDESENVDLIEETQLTVFNNRQIDELTDVENYTEELDVDGFDVDEEIEIPNLENLPAFFQSITSTFENHEKLNLLIASATTIGAIMDNVYFEYDGSKTFPYLFFYVIGKAGTGKGSILWSKKLVSKIDSKSMNVSEDVTPMKLFIPANNSAAGFLEMLSEQEGIGILFESEGDTISNSIVKDYGNYSDMMRKGNEHEPITSYRKTNKESFNVEVPKLAIVISSTPNQVKRMLIDPENGLVSRFVFGKTKNTVKFKNVFETNTNERNQNFDDAAEVILQIRKKLVEIDEIKIVLTPVQQSKFLEKLGFTLDVASNMCNEELSPSVKRTAKNMIRLMSIFTIVEVHEKNPLDKFKSEYICSDVIYDFVMNNVFNSAVANASEVVNLLTPINKEMSTENSAKMKMYKELSFEFTTKQALQVGSKFGLGKRTIERFIKTSCFEKVKHSLYRKIDDAA